VRQRSASGKSEEPIKPDYRFVERASSSDRHAAGSPDDHFAEGRCAHLSQSKSTLIIPDYGSGVERGGYSRRGPANGGIVAASPSRCIMHFRSALLYPHTHTSACARCTRCCARADYVSAVIKRRPVRSPETEKLNDASGATRTSATVPKKLLSRSRAQGVYAKFPSR